MRKILDSTKPSPIAQSVAYRTWEHEVVPGSITDFSNIASKDWWQ